MSIVTVTERDELLLEKDKWSKARRRLYEQARLAGEELDGIESKLRQIEHEEIKVLRDEADSAQG